MKESKFANYVIKFLILIELAFFLLGISSTLIITEEFWIFSQSFSMLGALELFYRVKEFTLFLIILIFGISAPLLKILLKFFKLKFMVEILHRFTFLDIFLVVVLIYVAKSSAIIDANVGVGFWYLLSALLISYVQMFVQFISKKQEINANER